MAVCAAIWLTVCLLNNFPHLRGLNQNNTNKKTQMNINEMYPSKWLKSSDIGDRTVVVTIAKVLMEDLGQGENKDRKPCVYFEGKEKALALNKTNASTIAKLYGPSTDGWIGKRISIYSKEVEFKGEMVLALRVSLNAPGAKAPAPAAAPMTATVIQNEPPFQNQEDEADAF